MKITINHINGSLLFEGKYESIKIGVEDEVSTNNLHGGPFASPTPIPLEDLLTNLLKYGKPRIGYNDGWYAAIDMATAAEGADFKICSEFGHKTPRAALAELATRVIAVLKAQRGL